MLYGMYNPNQKFDSTKISVLRDTTKIFKKSTLSLFPVKKNHFSQLLDIFLYQNMSEM